MLGIMKTHNIFMYPPEAEYILLSYSLSVSRHTAMVEQRYCECILWRYAFLVVNALL